MIQVSSELSDKQQEVDVLTTEIREKEAHWKAKKDEFEAQMIRNQEENEEAAANLKTVQEELSKEKEATAELKNQLNSTKSQSEELKSEVDRLLRIEVEKSQEIDDLKKSVSGLVSVLHSLELISHSSCLPGFQKLERDELNISSEALRIDHEKLTAEVQKLETSLKQAEERRIENVDRLEKEKAKLEKDVEDRETTLQAIQEALETKDNVRSFWSFSELPIVFQEIESLKTSQKVVEEELVSKIQLIETFNSRIEEFEKEMAVGKRKIEQLEQEKAEEMEKLVMVSGTQSQKQQELDALKKKLMEKEAVVQKVRTLDYWKRKESHNCRWPKAKSSLRQCLPMCRGLFRRRLLRKLRKMWVQSIPSLSKMWIIQEQLMERIDTIEKFSNEKISDLESRLEQKERLAESLNSELAAVRIADTKRQEEHSKLQKEYEELKKAEAMWQGEKDMLIERCLGVESDIDYEKERSQENKRQFDEALAAMHELGRANQSLQVSRHVILNHLFISFWSTPIATTLVNGWTTPKPSTAPTAAKCSRWQFVSITAVFAERSSATHVARSPSGSPVPNTPSVPALTASTSQRSRILL